MFEGVLKKMITERSDPIKYFLDLGNDFLIFNQIINHKLKIIFDGSECLNCKKQEVIFRQGYCKSCFFKMPSMGDWIIRPELSKAHLGIQDRDLEYEKKIQLQPHIVYLALSSHLKVGVTRKSQIPTRWIDQGAHMSMALIEVPNRYLAGTAEVALKKYYSDKTNWREMLKNNFPKVEWKTEIDKAISILPSNLKSYKLNDSQLTELKFPVEKYPNKVRSLNIQKENVFSGVLKGIKGQYLIFEDETVFNIRSNEGSKIKISIR